MRAQKLVGIAQGLVKIAMFGALALGCGTTTSGSDGGANDARGIDADRDAGARDDAALGDTGLASDAGPTGSGRAFPDTSTRIAILADQLPNGMTPAQQRFAVDHYDGTQKLTLEQSMPLRALDPTFLVLHYHLAMWQSASGVDFIVDGHTWGNDYASVTTHDDWFWHDAAGERVASNVDGKWLMNVGSAGFGDYWATSIAAQTLAGDYDGVFLDSASPALLSFEAQAPPDPRIAGTGVRDNTFTELGGHNWITGWQDWIATLDMRLGAGGIPLIANTGAFITSWDDTDYGLTAGFFSEGFADPSFAESDWRASTDEILRLIARGKIAILQNYLGSPGDVALRTYYLANYLLVRGARTYLFYFADTTLEWYPEWDLDLGAATTTATTVAELASGGVYRRDFANGIVLVNPSSAPVTVDLGGTFQRVVLSGGGAVGADGSTTGTSTRTPVTSITVAPTAAEILMR